MGRRLQSCTLVTLMLASIFVSMIPAPEAEASLVVITEPVQLVDDGANNRMVAMDADSLGNIHAVYSQNTRQMYYTMLDPRSQVLIAPTQISNNGGAKSWHPDIAVDSMDRVHIVWADKSGQHSIVYTVINPWNDDRDGTATDDGTLSIIEDTIVSQRAHNRDWPSLAIDSRDNVHIAWEDSYDELSRFYQQPQIYYSMLEPDYAQSAAITVYDDTLLTPIIGHKGHPDIVVDADDFVQIAWDDTRGGKVELTFVIDTSGSMYSEWADVCTVIYGGTFSSGGYNFMGLKPMLEQANMTVFETLYGLGNYLPGAASTGNCAGHNMNAGPRNTALGLTPGDDSGGIRKLPGTVYNGGTYSGYSGEDWGPGSNWACLSWMDSSNNVPGNPPTTDDHHWNPNATKIVIPISDEGPKDGDPAGQTDDHASIAEAHDSCVRAGVIPVGMYGQTYGGGATVQSHFKDLAQCPDGVQGTHSRNCPGTTIANSDAGGQVYEFPSSGSGSSQMALLVEAMVYISTNNSREIYMSVLDPYNAETGFDSSGFAYGLSGTSVSGGNYYEDIGGLIAVNDTRITIDDAYSFHPSIGVDMDGNTHIVWMDGRDYGFEKDVSYEIYYTKLRLRGAGDWDGVPGGLSTYAIKKIEDTPISNVEGKAALPQNNKYAANSMYPELLTDDQNHVHIAWLDYWNTSAQEEIQYVRLNETSLTGPGEIALDAWEPVVVTNWQSNKLGPSSPKWPGLGQPPAFANDLGSGAHLAWTDTAKCGEEGNNNMFTICYTHILTGQVDIEFGEGETYYHVIEPGEQTIYNLTLNNTTPGPADLVSDTYSLNLSDIPANWSATLYFSNNHTAIFPSTPIFLLGGDSTRFYLRVRAPSIYQANEDELAEITVIATSHKDPAIRSDRMTLTLMDVVHGINLDTSHRMADVEQGQTAIFSITITNTGNVHDSFAFYDPASLEGQQEWLLPFGWQVEFPLEVELDPGQSTTKNLKVSIPTTQEPGTFVLYVKGWSIGEPIKSISQGTYDVLELWINVSIRSTGNIVFEIFDTMDYVLPGDCAVYEIAVTKHFADGWLIFTTPGAPAEMPEGSDIATWAQDHWTVELDFDEAPADPDGDGKRRFMMDTRYKVKVSVCAPTNASAGLGPAVTIKAHLDGHARVSDSVILSTNVVHVYDLNIVTMDEEITDPASPTLDVNPGEDRIITIRTTNEGNGPDRYDMRLARVTKVGADDVLWDVEVPRNLLQELERGTSQELDIGIHVPQKVEMGEYKIVIEVYSEEAYPQTGPSSTKLRDTLVITVNVLEFHDMQISIDSTIDTDVKTAAPGQIIDFTVNITNAGNVEDTPALHNHTAFREDGEWVFNEEPGMGTLTDWTLSWAVVLNADNSQPEVEVECLELTTLDVNVVAENPDDCIYFTDSETFQMPTMDAYETITMRAILQISTNAKLDTRPIGLKVTSMNGGMMEELGDYDDSASWQGEMEDSNEQVVTIRLRAPNLEILEVEVGEKQNSAEVGEFIPVRVLVQNSGNVHATDVVIVLCQGQEVADIRSNGCDEANVVFKQVIGALMPPDGTGDPTPIELYLLWPVDAGSHEVSVVMDPDNEIVESSENDNIKAVPSELESSNPLWDVTSAAIATYSLPVGILLLTLSLGGVVFMVGRGRTLEAKNRLAEQSSLLSVLGSEEDPL